ncbi:MAG TPA: SDR family oxidoreductase [Chloroflexota bacterium]
MLTPRQADLRGQVALITGGSRGLGLVLARELANAGCKLAICARDEAELTRAAALLSEPRGRSGQDGARMNGHGPMPAVTEVMTVTCDVSDRSRIPEMVDRVTRRFGRIDILVNNAGVIQVTPLGNATRADFQSAMDIMFWGMYDVTMAVLPGMLAQGYGRIANVTSIGGKISVPHLLPYSAAKFAATGFSEGLRAELAGKNVTVTTIVPGLMRTGSIYNVLVKGDKRREFAWFSVLASVPGLSMSADRAARRMVRAVRRGQAEAIVGAPAKVAVRGHALFPNLSAAVLGLVNRCLPKAVEGDGMIATLSHELESGLDRPALRRATILSRQAAIHNNELPRSVIDGQQVQPL